MSRPSFDELLAAAIAAIERADDAAAIDQLLAAWAHHRAPTIARVIELVELCALGFPKPRESGPGTPARLVAASPLERGALLRRLEHGGGIDQLPEAWLDALLELRPDPRVGAILDSLVHHLPVAWQDFEDDGISDPELDLEDPNSKKFDELSERHASGDDDLPQHHEHALADERMAERVGEVVAAGAKAITVRSRHELTPGVLARLRHFDFALTIEIDRSVNQESLAHS